MCLHVFGIFCKRSLLSRLRKLVSSELGMSFDVLLRGTAFRNCVISVASLSCCILGITCSAFFEDQPRGLDLQLTDFWEVRMFLQS